MKTRRWANSPGSLPLPFLALEAQVRLAADGLCCLGAVQQATLAANLRDDVMAPLQVSLRQAGLGLAGHLVAPLGQVAHGVGSVE